MNGHTERVAILALAVLSTAMLATAAAMASVDRVAGGQLVVAAVSALTALTVIASRRRE